MLKNFGLLDMIYSQVSVITLWLLSGVSALFDGSILLLSISIFIVSVTCIIIYGYGFVYKMFYGKKQFDIYINENKLYNKMGCFLVKRNLIGYGYEPQQMIFLLYIQEIVKLYIKNKGRVGGIGGIGGSGSGEGSGEEEPWYKKLIRKIEENKGKIIAVAGVGIALYIFREEISAWWADMCQTQPITTATGCVVPENLVNQYAALAAIKKEMVGIMNTINKFIEENPNYAKIGIQKAKYASLIADKNEVARQVTPLLVTIGQKGGRELAMQEIRILPESLRFEGQLAIDLMDKSIVV